MAGKVAPHRCRLHALAVALCAGTGLLGAPADARVTRLSIERDELVALPAFGATGPYRKITGTFEGELEVANPRNAVIADLPLAAGADGKARYRATFYVLRPADPSKANRRLLYLFNNRGSKLELRLNDARDSNDPTTAADFGNGWLNRQGYALAWSGWDGSVRPGDGRETIELPVARGADGSTLTGRVTVETVPADSAVATLRLPYRAAPATARNGVLTVREHAADAPRRIAGWSYAGDREIRLPAPVRPQFIYEFTYTAADPTVLGIGHAATRDFVEFLRTAQADDHGTPNPLAMPGGIEAVYAFGRSQGGRVQRDFLYWGFNEDEAGRGRRVFDGLMPYATGAGLLWMNVRFGQPNVSSQQHVRHAAPELEGPHAYPVMRDLLTGREDGILRRCRERDVCPKVMNVDSANEYWNKGSSLNHTDAVGRDLDIDALAPDVRLYAVASMQHSTAAGDRAQALPACRQLSNPLYQGPLFRALLVAMDEWVTSGTAPPPSRVPRQADGTLVPPTRVRFAAIPATAYPGWPPLPAVQFHPESFHRIRTRPGTRQAGRDYAAQVFQVDADGNDRGGVRLPLLEVPLGTHTGWSLLRDGAGGPDLCGQNGQFVPFAPTRAARLAAGDPRPSLEERYPSREAFQARLRRAIDAAVRDRLLLPEDAAHVEAAPDQAGASRSVE